MPSGPEILTQTASVRSPSFTKMAPGKFQSKKQSCFTTPSFLFVKSQRFFDMDYAQVYGKGLAHHVCILLALLFYVFNAFILIFEKNVG